MILMQWSWQTILMGICFLVLLLLARHVVCCSLQSFFFCLTRFLTHTNNHCNKPLTSKKYDKAINTVFYIIVYII